MTQKETKHSQGGEATQVGSAPELPTHVARQFGLHHDPNPPGEEAPDAEAVAIAHDGSSADVTDDPKTDAAVDDILAKESDALLAAQDAVHQPTPTYKRGFWRGIGHFFAAWWHNKWARWITATLLLAAIGTVVFIQDTRYAVLNTVGVRSSASVIVLDDTTQLPLKNVSVMLGSKKAETNRDGIATFTGLRLGEYHLRIKRIAFAPQERNITIGWGSNPLGTFALQATGTQYTILVSDYLSGRPVANAEAVSDEVNALSDSKGKLILTVEDTDVTKLSVTLSAAGYRSETTSLDAAVTTDAKLSLVPAAKSVFVSKQSGKYDVYSMDLDGKDRKMILAGTGLENATMSLVVNNEGNRAALVSTRDDLRDSDGYLLHALTIIDLETDTSVTVDHAEQIQLVDWIGDRIIYRSTTAGASAADSQRNRLISLKYEANARTQLATANQFNGIVSTKGYIYYGASSTDPQATLGLFRVKPDGSDRKRLSEDEVWTVLRMSYNNLHIQTPDGWNSLNLDNEQLTKSSAPPSTVSYSFTTNAKGKQSLWTDIRDGKGTLLEYDIEKGSNRVLTALDGLTNPLRWAGDKAIIFRVATSGEIADYAVSPEGGTPRKIVDVTATYGFANVH